MAALLILVLLHPVHETVSEVEWNDESKRLEVSLRLDPLDEQWLAKRYADPDRREVAAWATEYLRDRYRITASAGNADGEVRGLSPSELPADAEVDSASHESLPTARYHWIGRQDGDAYVWWFFEIEPVNHKRPDWIDIRLLFERHPDYANRVLLLGDFPRESVVCTRLRPQAFLTGNDERLPSPESAR